MSDHTPDERAALAAARIAQANEQTELAEARARFDALFSDNWKDKP